MKVNRLHGTRCSPCRWRSSRVTGVRRNPPPLWRPRAAIPAGSMAAAMSKQEALKSRPGDRLAAAVRDAAVRDQDGSQTLAGWQHHREGGRQLLLADVHAVVLGSGGGLPHLQSSPMRAVLRAGAGLPRHRHALGQQLRATVCRSSCHQGRGVRLQEHRTIHLHALPDRRHDLQGGAVWIDWLQWDDTAVEGGVTEAPTCRTRTSASLPSTQRLETDGLLANGTASSTGAYVATNWRGKPLVSLATVVQSDRRHDDPQQVRSETDTWSTAKRVKVTDEQMQRTILPRHELRDRNYMIRPPSARL